MENFKYYNQITFKNNENLAQHDKFGNENDAYMANVVQTRPNGQMQSLRGPENEKMISTPSMSYKQAPDLVSATNCTTMSKQNGRCRPPSMRIKRSSSKKNKDKKAKFFGSADMPEDGKNRSLRLVNPPSGNISDMRKSEDIDHKRTTQKPSYTAIGDTIAHKNLLDKNEAQEKALWDKRFIEYSAKARNYDLIPRPEANYLKRILETEKDER